MIGIYKITYVKTGKCYVGSSIDIDKRWKSHIKNLKSKSHHSKGLQNVYNKHGLDVLKFEVIEECNVQDLRKREEYWINKCDSYFKGFNSCRYVKEVPEYSESHKKMISEKTKNGMNKPEIKLKMRNAKLGNCYTVKLTEEQVTEIKITLSKELINRRILAKQYNVSVDAIDDIISGKNWSHVRPDLILLKNTTTKLTENDVIEIKKLLKENKLKQWEIANKYNVIQQTISNINRNKIWSHIKID